MNSILSKYFRNLTETQLLQLEQLDELYRFWNSQINVISRRDIDSLFEKHVLHSLAIAKLISFSKKTKVMDVGCGGGFPGIPLAILFPDVEFLLVDSISKKIKVVNEVSNALNLKNVNTFNGRAEQVTEKFEFIVSRAVTDFSTFYRWVQNKISSKQFNELPNGILYLKGGDLTKELRDYRGSAVVYDLKNYFEEEFFETKKVVYIGISR